MQMGRRKRVPDAAIDSTGLEATCASAFFVRRRNTQESLWKKLVYRRSPKLSLVSDVRTHFILAYRVGKGPRTDVDEIQGLIDQAPKRVRLLMRIGTYELDRQFRAEPGQGIRLIFFVLMPDNLASGYRKRRIDFNKTKLKQT